jgi:hypothetical protein
MLEGNPHAQSGLTALVADLVSRETQLSILDEQQSALEAELATIGATKKSLAKILARPKHELN